MKYHDITPEMTIGDLVKSKVYGDFGTHIFTDMTPDHWNALLASYGFKKVGFVPTLHRMEELASTGKNYLYPLYSEEERMSEWDKESPAFLHFPGPVAGRPYAIIIPGGAFNRQWGLVEGMAIAAALNEMGYTAFVLFYRTKQDAVVAKAIEDMYACIRQIEARADEFEVQAGHYMIGGFSAGATLAGEIGSTNFGWKSAGVPKPEMIFLAYTAVRMKDFYAGYTAFPIGHPVHDGAAAFLRRVAGPEITPEAVEPFDLTSHMDASYPPVYLTANEDDHTAPFSNSLTVAETCEKLGIPHKTKFGKTGDHGFGLGIGLEVEGWLSEAVSFWEEVR